ncbi:MAG: glucose-6-phosphate dehydrogenase [Phycisphaerae bacterium]
MVQSEGHINLQGLRGQTRSQPEPFVLVIFGASGDLTSRKLMPAVCSLFCQQHLPEDFILLGYGRTEMTDDEFRQKVLEESELRCKREDRCQTRCEKFVEHLHYQHGQYDDSDDIGRLKQRIGSLCDERDMPPNCLFYLSTPPRVFGTIASLLDANGLARRSNGDGEPWSRIVIEKPFGYDLATASDLNVQLSEAFDEEQIYRIDHYLGKETVQNLLVLRFANAIFEPLWNQKYVDHVQITVGETLGVEGRGSYYDRAGAIRDMAANHMMHLLSLVAMEPPVSLSADAVRDEKVQVLRALRPISPECAAGEVVQGQYTAGEVDGEQVPGYREEEDVPEDSVTPTYVAFKAMVDNWRWAGVPFYLRHGKRLAKKVTEISIHFREVPRVLFNLPPTGPMDPNVLVVRIQPDEGVSLQFQVKRPGPSMHIEPFEMNFTYAGSFGQDPPDAYERLLLDAALGDATLFTRSDETEAAWAFVNPLLEGCRQQDPSKMANYESGTWGPQAADLLIRADGNQWRLR